MSDFTLCLHADLAWFMFITITMVVTFPVSVTKYSGESNLRGNGFVLAYSSKAMVGEVSSLGAWGQLVMSHPQVLTCSF